MTGSRRLVAFGHSWVAGDGASGPDHSLVSLVANALGVLAVNLGVGGSASGQTADLVADQGVPAADVYVVMTGLNDARLAGSRREALDAYRTAVDVVVGGCLAATRDAPVLVVEQPALVDYSLHAPHDRGSTEAVDLYNAELRSALAGVARVLLVRVAEWDAATMLAADTVHPNDLGHAAVAHAVVVAYRAATMGSTSPVQD